MPFDRTKSMIKEKARVLFLKSDWNSKLNDVPGIGPATVEKLNAKGITTLYQLAGVFLTFKSSDVDEDEWCNKFWEYLTSIGVTSGHKAGMIDCLGEKLAVCFPGIYTPQ